MYADPRSPEETPEDNALSAFGIGEDLALKSWPAYQELASDEPMDNIRGEAPPEVNMAAMHVLARRGITDRRAPDVIFQAMSNAQSPKEFWTLLETYRARLKP